MHTFLSSLELQVSILWITQPSAWPLKESLRNRKMKTTYFLKTNLGFPVPCFQGSSTRGLISISADTQYVLNN